MSDPDPAKLEQYARKAAGWSEDEYADPVAYLAHRAELVVSLGPRLEARDEVLDLACGDGGLGVVLLARGYRYRGVDTEPAMVEAARARLDPVAGIELGELDAYAPPHAVAATTVFRAIYYARDRKAFFSRVAEFTERKLVFDLNPRQYPLEPIRDELRAAGFTRIDLRPFFVPQTVRLPRTALVALRLAERTGPLARLALRRRFTYVVAASRLQSGPGQEPTSRVRPGARRS